MDSTISQIPIFLATIYGGILIGVLYDVFRLLRMLFQNVIIIGILDALYYALAGILFAVMLLIINDGEFRLYTVIGALIGALSEQYFVSALIRDTLCKLKNKLFPPKRYGRPNKTSFDK